MAISLPQGNELAANAAERILDAIGVRFERALAREVEAGGGDETPASLGSGIPIFTPPLSPASSLSNANQTGWRYLVTNSTSVGAVDVSMEEALQPQVVLDPALAERMIGASRTAESILENSGDYQLRLLDLNLIGDSVLWLARDDGPDRFFSLTDASKEVTEKQIEARIKRGIKMLSKAAVNTNPEAGG